MTRGGLLREARLPAVDLVPWWTGVHEGRNQDLLSARDCRFPTVTPSEQSPGRRSRRGPCVTIERGEGQAGAVLMHLRAGGRFTAPQLARLLELERQQVNSALCILQRRQYVRKAGQVLDARGKGIWLYETEKEQRT